MAMRKKNIPLLKPVFFKEELIKNTRDFILNHVLINDFFIHSFERDEVQLKLPLPPHKKTVHDFVLILRGEMTKSIGLKTFKLQAGQFLFTPKNSITTTKNVTKDLGGFYGHFSDEFLADHPVLKQSLFRLNLQNSVQFNEKELQNLKFLLERLLQLYRNQKGLHKNLIQAYLSVFLTEITTISEEDNSKNTVHPLVLKFTRLANIHFKTSRKVKFYADLMHITPNHLNKVIKKETGNAASTVIHQICILEAKVLLTQTNLDISEIAWELGFADASYFSRYFKKQSHSSPTKYRKMIDLS